MLQGLIKGRLRPPRVTVYGPPKVGKSSFGAASPSPVFVTTEEGVDNLQVAQFPVPAGWSGFLENVKQIAEGDHDHKTVVIDTLNGAVDLASAHVCSTQFKGDWGPKGFGSFGHGWVATSDEFRKLLPMLDQCRAKGMTVLLLAHTGTTNVKNPIDGDYMKFCPDVDRRIWARISAWCDIIMRADYEYSIIEQDGKKKAVGSNTRILIASGSAAEDAGARVGYDLPDRMPLSWDDFAAHLGHDDSVMPEIKRLWHLLGADDAQKALRYMGIQSIDSLDKCPATKAKMILNKLKIKEQENAHE